MNVGSVSRSQSLDTTTPIAPPMPSDTAPIDLSRDVADTRSAPMTGATHASGPDLVESPPRPPSFVDPQVRHAAEAFTRGGLGGLETWMQQHPGEARWILSVPRGELAAGLQTDLASRPGYQSFLGPVHAYTDAAAIDAHLAGSIQPTIREAVRQTAVGRIDAMTVGLESMSIDGVVRQLRAAPAGSELGALRSALGLRGDAMDAERVEGWQRRALGELHALRDTVMGQTWMPEELPGSMAHVQQAMGLERCTPGSIAGQAFFRGPGSPDAMAHGAESALDLVLLGSEVVELARHAMHLAGHGGAAALATDAGLAAGAGGLGVGLAGLAFGYVLHHQIEENRAERTETARALGL